MAVDSGSPLAAEKGEAALQQLRQADPSLYLSPSANLAAAARAALKHLHSSLAVASPVQPPPLQDLLAGPEFDAEQIWSQSELLARPLLPHLHRQLRRLEHQAPPPEPSKPAEAEEEEEVSEDEEGGDGDDGDELNEAELEDIDDELESGEDEDEEEEEDDEEEETEELEGKAGNRVEDKFLKINELEKFLEQGEEAEYGGSSKEGEKKKKKKAGVNWMEDESDEDMDEDGDEDEDDDDLDLEDIEYDDDEEDGGKSGGDIRYEDFFEGKTKQQVKKRNGSTKKVQFKDELHEVKVDHTENDDGNVGPALEDEQGLSTHEKERLKMHAKIEQMEKASLEPSVWTMKGEVTASSRPRNSALEVDLDFEHNVRPAPVITEEVTASLEEMIKKRIAEGHFDDVEKPSTLPSKAPKEQKEMDENKSKKGLAELYEEDYVKEAGLAPAPLSISDELKKEANTLFKRICLKLDALSHFHFAPKPVIEDMSIQANVPALAMEEVAPVAVSDAAMLAPEEVFEGKGDIKEEAELTQAERKRRRANKKRRYAESHKDKPAESHKERPAKLQKD
ncbi:U3 small nucleolar ribonucleoprotein protein MPP10 [Brachypodium distachyon]|uniref:U3 small nucleolar ribonucleoprotein protein MPP10 n=1 Tax=Brachypodium distachyon TaxID=15368 RepID=I1IUP6_BRADI|nr:U3 small nucleolar ribonucleoprotein protein MPP10 [Brachypodium distachyon]KQJ92414.1 hypothetical protein BRADI_4g43500v3 [Brachypodium distachyon]|eukprot:XP_014758081.1 U3 small nucleolar ribonucleoprotein protein MPP10 [Brachypodium distachyon]